MLARHQEHRLEPQPQWPLCPVKHRARGDRGLMATGLTFKKTTPGQGPGLSFFATRATKPLGPSLPHQVGVAGVLRTKALLKLDRRPRKIRPHRRLLHPPALLDAAYQAPL